MHDFLYVNVLVQGLRTPNEDINQRNLKILTVVADKICCTVPKYLGVGVDFGPYSEGSLLSGRP